LRKFTATTIREYLNESFTSNSDYIAPNGKNVYRAEHSNKKGNWFAFSKDDAIGYANYGDKIISKNISGLKFVNITKIMENGEYFNTISNEYPYLFKITNNGLWDEYELNVGLSEYFETIKSFLHKNGYDGVFTNKKLSIDYEVYLF
jgi:hypothetical protein